MSSLTPRRLRNNNTATDGGGEDKWQTTSQSAFGHPSKSGRGVSPSSSTNPAAAHKSPSRTPPLPRQFAAMLQQRQAHSNYQLGPMAADGSELAFSPYGRNAAAAEAYAEALRAPGESPFPSGTYNTPRRRSPGPSLQTPPALYQPAQSFANSQRGATTTPRRLGTWQQAIRQRNREDHIVFENTLYEDPTDPIFYASNRAAMDGGSDERSMVHDDETEPVETDFGALVEQFGFPGRTMFRCRRRFVTGSAHEKTMTLFGEPTWDADSRPHGRRYVAPQPQSMSNTFQARGDEIPFFQGGKRVHRSEYSRAQTPPPSGSRVPVHLMTQRVIEPQLQDAPPPLRTQVRVITEKRLDSLHPSLQGSRELELKTRRSFFDIRR